MISDSVKIRLVAVGEVERSSALGGVGTGALSQSGIDLFYNVGEMVEGGKKESAAFLFNLIKLVLLLLELFASYSKFVVGRFEARFGVIPQAIGFEIRFELGNLRGNDSDFLQIILVDFFFL